MFFSSLCFYEKQVTDNNCSDTSTYFLVNFALVLYYTYTVGMKLCSQKCVLDASFSTLFCLDAELLHCCQRGLDSWVWAQHQQRDLPKGQGLWFELVLNVLDFWQVHVAPDFTFSDFWCIFSYCGSLYNTSLIEIEHDNNRKTARGWQANKANAVTGGQLTGSVFSGFSCIFQL